MFSAIKRFASKNDLGQSNAGGSCRPPSHQTMSTSLQRKFARGVQYNMKIIIKGDRNVGKTCLFHRLQGKKFFEQYIPTEEIQVASIQWNYKATDDVVKVEVWDVVDRGKKKKRFDGLKLENSQLEMPEEPALDAEFLDVYKGTNGVILMMDLTKSWTFDYVQREMPKIPGHIPVIILANHCDMAHHRTVTSDHVTYYIESIAGKRSAQVRYSESSMRNGFGLKLLHKFFNLPFLQLQRETLLKQLERNEAEISATVQELDIYCSSDEANYNKFLDNLIKKRREIADSNANIPAQASAPNVSVSSHASSDVKRSQSGPIVIGGGKPIPFTGAVNLQVNQQNASGISKSQSHNSGLTSKMGDGNYPDVKKVEINPIASVEEFCPDGGQLDRSFLDDVQQSSPKTNLDDVNDSDSDIDVGNPLVSELQEDIEPDDVAAPSNAPNHVKTKMNLNIPQRRPVSDGSSEVDEKTQFDDGDMKQTNDEFDSTLNSEISELTSEAFDAWMGTDSKWRRSPEGGEDVSVLSQTFDYSSSTVYDDTTSVTSSNVHMELLSSKYSQGSVTDSVVNSDNDENHSSHKKENKKEKTEKKEKHRKSKDKEKHKEGGKREKRHKRRSQDENSSHRDELEEFLNGSASPPIDAAYEAI